MHAENLAICAGGGPALRRAWEQLRLKPAELAEAVGVSRAAVYKWAGEGAHTPAGAVKAVEAHLRNRTVRLEQERAEVLEFIKRAVAGGQGPTRAELRRELGASGESLLDEMLQDPLPKAYLHEVIKIDEIGRTYVREEIHSGPRKDKANRLENIDAHTLRGLRLYSGWSLASLAQQIGCNRTQLHAWEIGHEKIPAGRLLNMRLALEQACAEQTLGQARKSAQVSCSELARITDLSPALLKNAEYGHRRGLTWSELVQVGHSLERHRREAIDRLAADVAALLEVIGDGEPHGLTRNQLRLRLGELRTGRGPTGGLTIAESTDLALNHLLQRLDIEWGATDYVRGGHNGLPRIHLAGHGHHYAELPVSQLHARLKAAGAGRRQLAAKLGISATSVGEWMRSERAVPPPRVADVLRALDELDETRPDVPKKMLEAAVAFPGLTSANLSVRAGYGKSNVAALKALHQLIAEGKVHQVPRPRSFHIYPGPSPEPLATPMPGKELKRIRLKAGLLQRDVAAALGVTQSGVAGWEVRGLPARRRSEVEQLLNK